MSQVYKRELVFITTGIVALVMMLDYFFGKNIPGISGAGNLSSTLQTWALVIQLMAIGLGAINLIQVHYRQISRKTPMMVYSAVIHGILRLPAHSSASTSWPRESSSTHTHGSSPTSTLASEQRSTPSLASTSSQPPTAPSGRETSTRPSSSSEASSSCSQTPPSAR